MANFDMGANALLGIGQNTVRPEDPSEQISRFVNVRNALTGYKAEQAQSRALAGATDANGNTDYAKARAAMAADPDAQFNLAQGFSAQNRSRGEDLLNNNAQLAYQEHTRDAAAGAFIRLANNPTDANIKGTASFMAALTPNAAKQIHWTANNIMALPSAQQRAEAIKELATTSLPGHERVAQAFGTPTSIDDGQTIQTGTQAGGMDGGAFTPASGVQRQISPETNSSPMDIVNPDGSHSYVRRDQVVGGGSTRPTFPPEVMGDGRYPSQQPANPGYQSAPAAGQVEAQRAAAEATGREAGAQFGEAGRHSAGYSDRIYRAQKALQLLGEVSPASGKIGEVKNRVVNAAVSLGMVTPSDKTAAYDEANKYLTQMAMSQPGATHSNEQLATALTSNPSTHINNLAAQDVLRANIALDRRANAAYLAFHQKYPGTQAETHAHEWPSFQSEYTTKRDVRAFMFDVMSPQQRAKMWQGMSAKERASFRDELTDAEATGLVQAPR